MTRLSLEKVLSILQHVASPRRPHNRIAALAIILILAFTTKSTAMVAVGALHHAAAETTVLSYTISTTASAASLLTTPKFDDFQRPVQVRPLRIVTQVRTHREYTHAYPDVRFSLGLQPGQRKVVRTEVAGIRVITERVTTWDSTVVDRQALTRTVLRKARPASIVVGAPRTMAQIPTYVRFRRLAAVFSMVATAYTAGSASPWSTGYTATGALARYGVVAVDPRVIPLGTHLFIPGYGYAIAADTGGAIIGNRVDLCMDSIVDALNFGRQMIKVYILKE